MQTEEYVEIDDVEVTVAGQLPTKDEPEESDVEKKSEEPVPPAEEEEKAEPEEETEEPADEEPSPPEEIDETVEISAEDIKAEIAELEAARNKLKEETEYWRGEKRRHRGLYFAERDRHVPEEPERPAEPGRDDFESVLGPKPAADNFETEAEYYESLSEYNTRKAIMEYEAQRMTLDLQQQLGAFKETVYTAGESKYEDFEEVVGDPRLPITTQMLNIMRDLNNPEDVAYYLGRNPHETIKISQMTPVRIARELTQIEVKLAQASVESPEIPPNQPEKPKPHVTTKAPPPVRPIKGGVEQVEKDPDKMTPEEYRKWRERGGGEIVY